MISELDQIVLTTDLPEYDLKPGDIGTVVLVHQEGLGYTGSNLQQANLSDADLRQANLNGAKMLDGNIYRR